MILNISHFNVVPNLCITLDKERSFEVSRKEIYFELNLLEQYILLKAIYNHFKKLSDEDFKRIIDSYKNEQPKYMLDCIDQMIQQLKE